MSLNFFDYSIKLQSTFRFLRKRKRKKNPIFQCTKAGTKSCMQEDYSKSTGEEIQLLGRHHPVPVFLCVGVPRLNWWPCAPKFLLWECEWLPGEREAERRVKWKDAIPHNLMIPSSLNREPFTYCISLSPSEISNMRSEPRIAQNWLLLSS